MTPEEIRGRYHALLRRVRGPNDSITQTLDREIPLAIMELLSEQTAQIAELNALLNRTVGVVNFERLAMMIELYFDHGFPSNKGNKENP